MSWNNGYYPAAYRHQPVRLRQKAVEIANMLVSNGMSENEAVLEGLRRAREFYLSQHYGKPTVDTNLPGIP
jgi:uncharacterized protein YdaT